MTLRAAFGFLILFLIATIVMNAKASDIRVLVDSPKTPEDAILAVIPIVLMDNEDGTSTMEIFMCGAQVKITAPNKRWAEKDKELKKAFDDLYNKFCVPLGG